MMVSGKMVYMKQGKTCRENENKNLSYKVPIQSHAPNQSSFVVENPKRHNGKEKC